MAKINWKGYLRFSLVNIGVGVISACESENQVKFRELDAADNTPIKIKKVNQKSGQEVKEIVKGYEFAEGRFVTFTDSELDAARPESTRVIEIERFVQRNEISPVYFESPYYLKPLSVHDLRAYSLLRQILAEQQLVGVANYLVRRKQYLALVLPEKSALMLCNIRFATQVRTPEILDLPAITVDKQELRMAQALVNALRGPWRPGLYRDQSSEKTMEMIEEKRKTGKIKRRESAPDQKLPSDLVAQLRKSLAKTKRRVGRK